MMVKKEVLRPEGGRKATRARKPKVRTGCITCKKRRVKCDENKPECQRCVNFGIRWKCDGYVDFPPLSKKSNTSQHISHRPLLPTLLPEPTPARFQNQDEYHFFQLFTTQTAPHLGGFLDPVLWNRIVLQVSEAEASIRHAVISIGALDMTMVPSKVLGATGQTTKEATQCRLFALKQYSKAIKELRRKVFLTNYDLRTVLIASILIICFEAFHQNYDSATSQIRTTVRLIESRKKELGRNDDIEQDLLCTFDRLDIQTMSRTDPQIDLFTLDEHFALKDSNSALLPTLPDKFEDIATARNYLYNMTRRAAHFTFWFRKQQAMAKKDNLSPQNLSSSHFCCTDESVLLERLMRIQEAERWMQAFKPLYTKHRTPEQKSLRGRNFLAVTVMRLHYLIVILTRTHMFDTSELAFDRSIPVFREMVDLCEDLLTDRVGPELGYGKGEKIFVFEMQTLMALDNIAKKCRDPVVRRKAIRLLVAKPMREGVRDSVLSAKVGEWVMRVEEEGMVDGFIGEKWRTKDVSVSLDSEGRRAKITCWIGGVDGERREGVIEL